MSSAPSLQSIRLSDGAPTACTYTVSGSLSLPSRGSFHLSFTVLSTIGHQVVFRLGGWAPRIPCGFLVSARTPDTACPSVISITGLSPSPAELPISFFYDFRCVMRSLPRKYYYFRFGLFRFRSPLLAKSRLISFPPPT